MKGETGTMKTSIPVILIRGFLDAGKTTLINQMAADGRLGTGRLLLLFCEEGETTFDRTAFHGDSVTAVCLEKESQFERNYLIQLTNLHTPSTVVIECNVMWGMIEFEFPENWKIKEKIAVLAAPTLGLYLMNMRSFFGPMLSRCDQVFINRCEQGPESLSPFKAELRPLLYNISGVLIESPNGYCGLDAVEDRLPYELEAETIHILSEHYVFWFYDCQDHPDRYRGRKVTLNADIKKTPLLNPGEFALGKIAVTCCEADMSFLGYLAHYEQIDSFPQYVHVQATAVIHYRFQQNYNAVMPCLEVLHMAPVSDSREKGGAL